MSEFANKSYYSTMIWVISDEFRKILDFVHMIGFELDNKFIIFMILILI